jgi:ribosome-associated toxin RatA of RatAB toxin-antitoxin module
MHYTHQAEIAAPPQDVFKLAAAIERYPLLMEHHRRVDIIQETADEPGVPRKARMASRQWGLPLPAWVALQRRYPEEGRIVLEIVAGTIRGMVVRWSIFQSQSPAATTVILIHDWEPEWPVIQGTPLARAASDQVIGPLIVDRMVTKTLTRVKQLAEAGVRVQDTATV